VPATSAGTGIWQNCGNDVVTSWRRIFLAEEDSAGLPEYADTVIEAIGDRTDLAAEQGRRCSWRRC
jgi:hypothetical protein